MKVDHGPMDLSNSDRVIGAKPLKLFLEYPVDVNASILGITKRSSTRKSTLPMKVSSDIVYSHVINRLK